jgi:hypothetical protein
MLRQQPEMQASRERHLLFYATIGMAGASEIGENRNFIICLCVKGSLLCQKP